MTKFLFADDCQTTLAGSISSVATTLAVASGTGVLFPSPISGQQFVLSFTDAATQTLVEIMYCTSRSADTLTVVRGQEGTSSQAWNAGDICFNAVTAGSSNNFIQYTTGIGHLLNIQRFNSGSYVYSPVLSAVNVEVTVIGGGAGGTSCTDTTSGAGHNFSGGGGGAGGFVNAVYALSTVLSGGVVSGFVGSGGAHDSNGGPSTFGTVVSVGGGFNSGFISSGVSPGGQGGSTTASGYINLIASGTGGWGSDGQDGSLVFTGNGGNGLMGGHGRAGTTGGSPGGAPGAGGGGSYSIIANGGSGFSGIVIIKEYG